MHGVLYIPSLKKNLFLIGQFANKGISTTYKRTNCFMKDNERERQIMMIGKRYGKLCKLHIEFIFPRKSSKDHQPFFGSMAFFGVSTSNNTFKVWHERFGHSILVWFSRWRKKAWWTTWQSLKKTKISTYVKVAYLERVISNLIQRVGRPLQLRNPMNSTTHMFVVT